MERKKEILKYFKYYVIKNSLPIYSTLIKLGY